MGIDEYEGLGRHRCPHPCLVLVVRVTVVHKDVDVRQHDQDAYLHSSWPKCMGHDVEHSLDWTVSFLPIQQQLTMTVTRIKNQLNPGADMLQALKLASRLEGLGRQGCEHDVEGLRCNVHAAP